MHVEKERGGEGGRGRKREKEKSKTIFLTTKFGMLPKTNLVFVFSSF